MTKSGITDAEVDAFYESLRTDIRTRGYFLNPDEDFTRDLARSLLVNEDRYGYPACPCRLASGVKEDDRDIICPCDYRDQDVNEYGACYCALYVARAVAEGERPASPVPERRPSPEERQKPVPSFDSDKHTSLPYPVWRCRVCGYLCAREEPPEICPICKAKKERFERFA